MMLKVLNSTEKFANNLEVFIDASQNLFLKLIKLLKMDLPHKVKLNNYFNNTKKLKLKKVNIKNQ